MGTRKKQEEEQENPETISLEPPVKHSEEGDAEEIECLKKENIILNDKLLRLRAEFENYRNRTQRDISEARFFEKSRTLEAILPVRDHFKMALEALTTTDNLETIKEGMTLIDAEFDRSFDQLGVEHISTEIAFDPNIHEAISMEPSPDVEEGHIIREWKTGYRLGERVVRPASVVVSSGNGSESDKK